MASMFLAAGLVIRAQVQHCPTEENRFQKSGSSNLRGQATFQYTNHADMVSACRMACFLNFFIRNDFRMYLCGGSTLRGRRYIEVLRVLVTL